ncbi:MAG TPA: metalloregulator ArsR/SmtB family transcription factor [Bryobacterales bacterium]|nr:metalloregulator ArsR/SmtB family transcription factor [Bryobacterales bacterium]
MKVSSASGVSRKAHQFAALASPPRIQIVRLLLAAHALGGMPAGQIQAELRIPASTLTHHLAKLVAAGLVRSRKDRQWIWYAVDAGGLRGLLTFLFQECCTRTTVISPEELTMGRQS